MADEQGLVAAYVTQMQRAHATRTRGIATPEQRRAWEAEARKVIEAVRQEEREKIVDLVENEWGPYGPMRYRARLAARIREIGQ